MNEMEKREKKTITYRIGAIASNVLVALIFGIPFELATIFGVGIEVIHTGWYYVHEILWERKKDDENADTG